MTSESKPVEIKPVLIDKDINEVQGTVMDQNEVKMLRSRIDEQSGLICMLRQRANETLQRCQALERINTELENLQTDTQTKLQKERERSQQLEQRFMDLVTNHREMIGFKDAYKKQNAELLMENEELRECNKKMFSRELQENVENLQKHEHELRDLSERNRILENDYRDQAADFQMEMKKVTDLHQETETKLRDELNETQKQLKSALNMSAEMELKLKQNQERERMKDLETQEKLDMLMKDKTELLELSMQRGKMIQDKEEEIEKLEMKKQEAEMAKQDAEDRFTREASAVNKDWRVTELQDSLHKVEEKRKRLKKEFEAYKKHSSDLLDQEKELNLKLRHMMN